MNYLLRMSEERVCSKQVLFYPAIDRKHSRREKTRWKPLENGSRTKPVLEVMTTINYYVCILSL